METGSCSVLLDHHIHTYVVSVIRKFSTKNVLGILYAIQQQNTLHKANVHKLSLATHSMNGCS